MAEFFRLHSRTSFVMWSCVPWTSNRRPSLFVRNFLRAEYDRLYIITKSCYNRDIIFSLVAVRICLEWVSGYLAFCCLCDLQSRSLQVKVLYGHIHLSTPVRIGSIYMYASVAVPAHEFARQRRHFCD